MQSSNAVFYSYFAKNKDVCVRYVHTHKIHSMSFNCRYYYPKFYKRIGLRLRETQDHITGKSRSWYSQICLLQFPYSFRCTSYHTTPMVPRFPPLSRRYSCFFIFWSKVSSWCKPKLWKKKKKKSLHIGHMCPTGLYVPSMFIPVPLRAKLKVRGPYCHTSILPKCLSSGTLLRSTQQAFRHPKTKVSFRRALVAPATRTAALPFI